MTRIPRWLLAAVAAVLVVGCNEKSDTTTADGGTSTSSSSSSTSGTTSTTTEGGASVSATTTTPSAAQEVTMPNGLKYQDVVVGAGAEAMPGKRVSVHYTGRLTDGTQFDSSLNREPYTLTLGAGEVIKGWDQGIVGMKVGGKRKLTIPPALAYGPGGRPPVIPPNSTLLFDLELMDVR